LTAIVALRTHLFVTGHPIVSFTTGIDVDKLHNKLGSNKNIKFYTLTKPPYEKVTESSLSNYKVTKKGFLFFADYYGGA